MVYLPTFTTKKTNHSCIGNIPVPWILWEWTIHQFESMYFLQSWPVFVSIWGDLGGLVVINCLDMSKNYILGFVYSPTHTNLPFENQGQGYTPKNCRPVSPKRKLKGTNPRVDCHHRSDSMVKRIMMIMWLFWENVPTWWFQPIWKILVKLDHFPK